MNSNQELLDYAVRYAKDALAVEGGIELTLIGFVAGEQHSLVDSQADSPEMRAEFPRACAEMLAAKAIDRYVVLVDSYVRDRVADMSVQERVTRREFLTIMAVSREGKIAAVIPYARQQNGNTVFEEIVPAEVEGGELADLLPPGTLSEEERAAAENAYLQRITLTHVLDGI